MGYILPIPNFEHQDYHSRVVKSKQDPFLVQKLYHAQLTPAYEENKQLIEKQNMNTNKLHISNTFHQATLENIYAEMAGVGRSFNEKV